MLTSFRAKLNSFRKSILLSLKGYARKIKRMNDLLTSQNPHARDQNITFDEGPHIYNIDGDKSYTSVTKWNHSHFKQFDANLIINKMMRSKKWPKSKYFGKKKIHHLTLMEFNIL